MNRCRNCGKSELQELGFTGKLAAFFLKRVFGARVGFAPSHSRLKRSLQRVASLPQAWLNRVRGPAVFVEMQICLQCAFIQTKLPFEESAINRLYADYRSGSYNRERIEFEPSYAAIAEAVGQHDLELETRVAAATKFLKDHIQPGADFTILDYGGADGKFLPRLDGKKFVFEISNIEPIAGITRIRTEAEIETYSLVQLTHVIEHVVQPLDLVRYVSAKLQPGGFLYLETPQELTDAQRAKVKSGKGKRTLHIHEHINSYCVQSVAKLIEAAGLRLVAIEAGSVDVGWGKAMHIRALGQL